MNTKQVITRYPPSPTGLFHLGQARTALYNYLFAIQNDGKFIFRFEDTDRERSKVEFESNFIESLSWLGITQYDQPHRQSERSHIYRSYIEKMIADETAYISEEEAKEEGQRSSVIRFKNPNEDITFFDIVRGEITVNTEDLGDFVIAKSLDEPLYHLTVVVDDYEGNVTHVIRGEDHISNTPRQILLQRSVGAPEVMYAHMPMILGPDKSKLSKRHGAAPVLEYRERGFLPIALVNYLALLGWHPGDGDNQEIFTFDELVAKFELSKLQKSGAIFSDEKLLWVNKQHLDKLSDGVFFQAIQEWLPEEVTSLPQYSKDRLVRFLPELRERISVYSEIIEMTKVGDLDYVFDTPGYFVDDLVWKKSDKATAKKHLEHCLEIIESSDSQAWQDSESLKDLIWPYADQEGRGEVLWPLRYSLSGVDRSPSPFSMLYTLGKAESINRIKFAISLLV